MAVLTIPIRPVNHDAPSVVEIPLEDPVATYRPQVRKVKHEPIEQHKSRITPEHEGSRRRRRYEMQNLLGCPQRVEPSEEDWSLLPTQHRTISWEKLATTDATSPIVPIRRATVPKNTILPRAIRQEIKRVHVTHSFVYSIEKEFRDVVDPVSAEPDYEVIETDDLTRTTDPVKRSVHIAVDAPTDKARSYSRWWIHLISRYYNLKSHSEDFHNQRVARIELTGHKLPAVWFCDLL